MVWDKGMVRKGKRRGRRTKGLEVRILIRKKERKKERKKHSKGLTLLSNIIIYIHSILPVAKGKGSY